MVIAIDGPAGSGKSTVARLLAERLGYTYVNSGNIYRAIALGCVRKGVSYEDQDAAGAYAAQAAIAYRDGAVYLDGEPVDPLLHTDEIDKFTPPLSAIPEVRAAVNRLIRQIAGRIDIIAEGRDMTTAVFPDAEHRFYLDASAEERAKRRFQQGVSQLSLEEIQRAIEERDKIDKNKAEGSLKIAPGVRVFDTSRLTIEEVYAILVATIKPKKNITEGSSMTQEVEMDESKHSADHIQTQLQMEEYLKTLESLEEGQIVEGAVIAVTEDQVFVDVGYKSEGKIPIAEFPEPPQVGDEVAVILIAKENKHGEVIVSKQKADIKLLWKNLRQAFQDRTLVEGTVESLVKGGYDFNLGEGVHAFLPISQSDSQKVDKPERLLGLKTPVYVERLYSDGKVNIVVNRRKWLEEAVEQKRADFFENTPIGADITGVVKSFTSFGAFIDLGGFDGLLHINDMSWGHVTRPKDFVKKGQEITLKVIRIDPEEKRINLSLKHFTDDPWVHFEDKYHVNDIITGKVTKLTDFGAFIEMEEGIEGLAHISEFSWVKKIQRPDEVVRIGDQVECMILGYDLQAGRVSLGLKQVTANPWDRVAAAYRPGALVEGEVSSITDFGIFVRVPGGIEGLIHKSNLPENRDENPDEAIKKYQVGNKIKAVVLEIQPDKQKVAFSIRDYQKKMQREEMSRYMAAEESDDSKYTLGDFLKSKGNA